MAKPKKRKSQYDRVLSHLRRRTLTPVTAWEKLGVYRLSSVINKMRERGMEIATEDAEVKNHLGETIKVARYRLLDEGSPFEA